MNSTDGISRFGYGGISREVPETDVVRRYTLDAQKAEPLRSNMRALWALASRLTAWLLANHFVILTMRWMVGAVFMVSACGKLVDIGRYSIAPVMEFGILPVSLAYPLGAVLPFVEALCALGLIFGVFTRFSALGILAMSTSFFIAKEIVLLQGGDIACGCFGAVVDTFASFTVYLDPPLMLMSLAVILSPRGSRHWISLRSKLSGDCMEKADRIW